MTKITTLAAAIALTLSATAPAHAQTVQSTHVPVSDLDLATAQGQRKLNLRIARAAEALCADDNARLSSDLRRAEHQCRRAATARAMASAAQATQLAAR